MLRSHLAITSTENCLAVNDAVIFLPDGAESIGFIINQILAKF